MTKTVKTRLNDLENRKADRADHIIVIWGNEPGPELQPGDVRIWMDENGKVRSEVIKA